MDRHAADVIRSRRAVIDGRHQDHVPPGQRPAQPSCDLPRFMLHADLIGGDGQMRPVLLEDPDRQQKERAVPAQRIDLRPRHRPDLENPTVACRSLRGANDVLCRDRRRHQVEATDARESRERACHGELRSTAAPNPKRPRDDGAVQPEVAADRRDRFGREILPDGISSWSSTSGRLPSRESPPKRVGVNP